MTFALLVFLTEVFLILFPGLVFHRALATRVLKLDAEESTYPIDEVQLLGFGILPGLALANTLGTVLAIVHLFYWWAYLTAVLLLLGWRWRDTFATVAAIGALVRLSFGSLLRGNLMVAVAGFIFVQTMAAMLVEAQLPSSNVDVWNHNFPLAQSIVAHHGFVMPQIDNMFYGTYPIFFHMFFAEGLLFFDNVMAAKAANALIYIGFLISLLAFARHGRAVAALFVSLLVINAPYFSAGAADAMTDIGRVCFSGLAFVFGYQYFHTRRLYFVFAAGLLAGGAIAGKYTELLTPMLIGAALLPALVARRHNGWLAVLVFVAATAITGAYPYLRNLILLHNPIYPFLFGHVGLSDAYMQALQAEVFHSLDPVFRTYSQNLFSFRGWRDLAKAMDEVFLGRWNLAYYLYAVIGAGMLFLRSRALIVFACWTFAMWIFWYLVGNMNQRWGLTPFMLFLLMAYMAIIGSIDRVAALFYGTRHPWHEATWSGAGEATRLVVPDWLTPFFVARIAVSLWALVIFKDTLHQVRANGVSFAFPPWMNRELARASLQPGGLQAYLTRNLQGYEIYRYIGDHDLRTVLHPFDNGSYFYEIAYNDGKNGDWMVPWRKLPANADEFDGYLRDGKVRYFVHYPSVPPLIAERLNEGANNPRHTQIASQLIGYLMPGSRLILTDRFGWELREISPDKLK